MGRTLGDIDLRADTGATILAIRRDGRTITSPAADTQLAAEDDLYLMGDEAHVRVAQARLTGHGCVNVDVTLKVTHDQP